MFRREREARDGVGGDAGEGEWGGSETERRAAAGNGACAPRWRGIARHARTLAFHRDSGAMPRADPPATTTVRPARRSTQMSVSSSPGAGALPGDASAPQTGVAPGARPMANRSGDARSCSTPPTPNRKRIRAAGVGSAGTVHANELSAIGRCGVMRTGKVLPPSTERKASHSSAPGGGTPMSTDRTWPGRRRVPAPGTAFPAGTGAPRAPAARKKRPAARAHRRVPRDGVSGSCRGARSTFRPIGRCPPDARGLPASEGPPPSAFRARLRRAPRP